MTTQENNKLKKSPVAYIPKQKPKPNVQNTQKRIESGK